MHAFEFGRPNDLVVDKKGGVYFTEPGPNVQRGAEPPPAPGVNRAPEPIARTWSYSCRICGSERTE